MTRSSLAALLREAHDPAIQISPAQIEVIASAIRARAPGAGLLVFGLGHDSGLWQRLNADGDTLFVEDKPAFIEMARAGTPGVRVVQADFAAHTSVAGAFGLPFAALDAVPVPDALRARAWDVILVDGPAGYWPTDPGRALPLLWTARVMARATHVFVDDYNRPGERHFADLFLRFDNPPCAELPSETEAGKVMLWRIGRSLA